VRFQDTSDKRYGKFHLKLEKEERKAIKRYLDYIQRQAAAAEKRANGTGNRETK
jgi:hypothetical protein